MSSTNLLGAPLPDDCRDHTETCQPLTSGLIGDRAPAYFVCVRGFSFPKESRHEAYCLPRVCPSVLVGRNIRPE